MTSVATLNLVEELKISYPNCKVGICVDGDGDYENTVTVEGGNIRGCLLFTVDNNGLVESSWCL